MIYIVLKGVSKVLKIIKNTDYNDVLYDAYNLLGLIYNELEDYGNAMVYHNKALASIDKAYGFFVYGTNYIKTRKILKKQ
jgi:tetratricopeptide (TPR) repeat protein